MTLALFSLKVAFALRAARDLSHFRRQNISRLGLYLGAKFCRPEIAVLSDGLGIPSNAQAPLAKSSIRSK